MNYSDVNVLILQEDGEKSRPDYDRDDISNRAARVNTGFLLYQSRVVRAGLGDEVLVSVAVTSALFPLRMYFTEIKNLPFLVDCVINTWCVIITRLSTQSVRINNFYRWRPAVNTGSNVPTLCQGTSTTPLRFK